MRRLRTSFNAFCSCSFFFIYYLLGKRQRKLPEHENVDIRFAIIDLRLSDARLRVFRKSLLRTCDRACIHDI